MIQKINKQQPFQVLASNFSIGPSNSGYDLEISADGVNYTTLFSVGANVTRMVTGVANGSYYRLGGNTDEDVAINWRTQCNDGQGGGGGGTGAQGPAGVQGPIGTAGAQGYQGPVGSGAYKIELSTANPEDFTEGDVLNLNAFWTAISEDSTKAYGAYIDADGDMFYLTNYPVGSDILTFTNTYYNWIQTLTLDFSNDEYTGAEYNETYLEGEQGGDSHILKGSSAIPQTESNDVFSIALQYPDVDFGTWTDNETTDQWWSENGGDRAIKYDTTANTYWTIVIEDTWYNMSYYNGEVKSQEQNVNYTITKYDDGKWIVSDARYTFFVEVSDAIYIYTLLDKGFHHCEGENNIYSTNEMTINSIYYQDGIYRAKAGKELIAAPSNAANATGENRTMQVRVYANPRNNVFLGSAADTFGNVYEIWLGAGGETAWMTLSGASSATATAELGGPQVSVSAISDERMGFTFKFTNGSSYNTIQAQGSTTASKFNRNLNLQTYEDYIEYHRIAEDWELPNDTRLVPVAESNGQFLLSHTTGGSYWEAVSFVQSQEIGWTDEEALNSIYAMVEEDHSRAFEGMSNKVYWMHKPQIDSVNDKVYDTNVMLRPISAVYDVDADMFVLYIKVDWTLNGDEMTIPMTKVWDNEAQDNQLMFLNTASTAGNYIVFGEAAQPAWQCDTSIVDSAGTILFASSWSNDEVSCSAATGISYAINGTDIVVEGFEAGATYTWSYTGADTLGETFMYRIPKRLG